MWTEMIWYLSVVQIIIFIIIIIIEHHKYCTYNGISD